MVCSPVDTRTYIAVRLSTKREYSANRSPRKASRFPGGGAAVTEPNGSRGLGRQAFGPFYGWSGAARLPDPRIGNETSGLITMPWRCAGQAGQV